MSPRLPSQPLQSPQITKGFAPPHFFCCLSRNPPMPLLCSPLLLPITSGSPPLSSAGTAFPSTSHCWDLPLCAGNWTLLTPKQKEAGEALEGGCECQGLAPCTDLNKRREKCCSPFCQPCSSRSAEQDHAGPWEKPVGKRLLFGFFQQPDGCCRPSALQGEAQTSFSLSHAIRGLANDGV